MPGPQHRWAGVKNSAILDMERPVESYQRQ
jgi:hypothetical protein